MLLQMVGVTAGLCSTTWPSGSGIPVRGLSDIRRRMQVQSFNAWGPVLLTIIIVIALRRIFIMLPTVSRRRSITLV